MRGVHTEGSTHGGNASVSSACLGIATTPADFFPCLTSSTASIFLPPFAPSALPDLNAHTTALTSRGHSPIPRGIPS